MPLAITRSETKSLKTGGVEVLSVVGSANSTLSGVEPVATEAVLQLEAGRVNDIARLIDELDNRIVGGLLMVVAVVAPSLRPLSCVPVSV